MKETPDGPFVLRFKNGRTAVEGKVHDGLREGEWSYWYPDGKLGMQGSFLEGKETGRWLITDPSHHDRRGDVLYSDGQKTGEQRMNFENGQRWQVCSFEDGRLVGTEIEYFLDGSIARVSEFKRGLKNGLEQCYHANGFRSSRGSYLDYKREGEWWWWRNDGAPSEHGFLTAKAGNGVWLSWSEDGTIDKHRSGNMVDGVIQSPLTDAQIKEARKMRTAGTQAAPVRAEDRVPASAKR